MLMQLLNILKLERQRHWLMLNPFRRHFCKRWSAQWWSFEPCSFWGSRTSAQQELYSDWYYIWFIWGASKQPSQQQQRHVWFWLGMWLVNKRANSVTSTQPNQIPPVRLPIAWFGCGEQLTTITLPSDLKPSQSWNNNFVAAKIIHSEST